MAFQTEFRKDNIVMNKCRLCQDYPGVYDIKSNEPLINEVFSTVNIKVDDKLMNKLPQCICETCKQMISRFFKYKKQVVSTDDTLRKIIEFKEHTKTYICADCHKTFNNSSVFRKHINSHSAQKLKESNDLKKVCDLSEEVDEIVIETKEEKNIQSQKEETDELHISTDNFICSWENCDKVFNFKNELRIHEIQHDEDKRLFLCVTCGKTFMTKNSLTCHEKIHLEIKAYICKICNLGFSVRSNLRAHEKHYHEGVRFYCSQCSRAFISKCSLERHEKIHTGVKDFQCESCPSAFYTKKELMKHQRYHQGLKLYKCDVCFKTFFERHHLTVHLRSHTGERPYVCKVPGCGKAYTESQKLKRHRNSKHDEK